MQLRINLCDNNAGLFPALFYNFILNIKLKEVIYK